MSDLVILALLWIAWCFLHSLLIARSVTTWLETTLGRAYAFHRLIYNLFSIASIVPVLWYQYQLEARMLFAFDGWWSLVRWVGLAASLVVFTLAALRYDQLHFMGIRQVREYFTDAHSKQQPFSVGGIHAWIRHPYYTGGMLFLLFYADVETVNLIARVTLFGYLIFGAYLEEKKLTAELGETYSEYQRHVGMFIPRITSMTKKSSLVK